MTTTISASASATAPISATPIAPATPATPVVATDSADHAGQERGHHPHGGHGHVRQALMQALQGMGLTLSKGADGGGAGNVKHDMAQFMHTLFQTAAGEAVSAVSSGVARRDPKAGFAAGLAALITEASSGNAPAALQQAFDHLAAHVQVASAPASGTLSPGAAAAPAAPTLPTVVGDAAAAACSGTPVKAAPTTDTAPASPTPPEISLQALLSRLQQSLGYGSSSRPSVGVAIGNTLDVTA